MEYKRRVIVSAIIEKDGKFLLTQQGDGNHKDLWAFPGGGLELNEENLVTALKREVREEIEVETDNETLLDAQVFLDPGSRFQIVAIFFRCRLKGGSPKLTEEIEDFKWLTPDELKVFPRKLLRPPVEWFDNLIGKLQLMKPVKYSSNEARKIDLGTKVIYKYPTPTREYDLAKMAVSGRHPTVENKFLLEHDCSFVICITKGKGRIFAGDEIFAVTVGDVVFVPKENKFAVEGKMEYVTVDVPAFFPEQSEEI